MKAPRDGFAFVAARKSKAGTTIFLLILALPWFGLVARAEESPRRVLMLHAFNYTFPATTLIAEAARKRLLERSAQKILIDADFLDLARVTDPGHEERTAGFLRDKYAHLPPEVVMTLGSAAFPFMVKHHRSITPNASVVFTSISRQTYTASQPPPQFTGVITEFSLDKTLILAERLQPDARRLFVIAGSGDTDRRWQPVARAIVESRWSKFETTYLFNLSYDKMISELSRVPRDAIVILLTFFADSEGKAFIPAEMATTVSAASPAPVYAPYDTFLGNGTVGGFVETFESVGIAAADLVLEILAGQDPATLPPRTNSGQNFRVDYRAMQRWNLRERDLPAGTEVLFKQPNIWDQHRNLVLAVIGVSVFQTAFAGALLIQRRRRQHVEVLLKESEDRMTYTAASVNIGLWQFDRKTNELWATEHCRALFVLGNDVPLTRETFLAAIHPEDRKAAITSLRQVSTVDQPAVTDVRVMLQNDQVRWIRIRVRSRRDDRGAPHELGGIFADITEQKNAEIETALQRQEVAHLMRVSVLGELSGAIAHEINQPLTAIQSNAETGLDLLAHKSPDLAELRDVLKDIVQDNRRASEVIQRLRDLMKKGERTSVAVDVNELVNSTVALLNSELISRGINVRLDLEGNLPATAGDPVQLQQVLLNLMVNAMDAMVSTPIAKRLVAVSTLATETGAVEVRVKDCGAGIHSIESGRLFEPFFTTKNHGLGLGLSICSTIVEAHGGDVTLANNESGGAIARFSLPAQKVLLARK